MSVVFRGQWLPKVSNEIDFRCSILRIDWEPFRTGLSAVHASESATEHGGESRDCLEYRIARHHDSTKQVMRPVNDFCWE